MARALLIVPHFWDPVCVPLGITSLKAFASAHGHEVQLLDLNTNPEIFGLQRAYFDAMKRQFPAWRRCNIERNGTELLAMHQVLYLRGRRRLDYAALVAELLDVRQIGTGAVLDNLDVSAFDRIFARLYALVERVVTRKIEQVQPDILGISLFNSTWAGTLFIAKLARTLLPTVRIAVGGPGPLLGFTAEQGPIERFLQSAPEIDFYVSGEGERPFLELLENPGRPPGILRAAADAKPLKLNALPVPDYGGLEVESYLQLSVASSRGCPFECSFCAETVYWNGFRSLPADPLYVTMETLARRHSRNTFYLCDSLANAVIGPLTSRLAAREQPYLIDCYLRADKSCVDPKKAASWRAGGLYRARLGMESASPRILEEMVKMTTPELMSRSLHALAQAGIMTSTLWIVGYPGETEAEFQQTLDFIREHRDQIYQSDAWLFQYHRDGLADSSGIDGSRGSRFRFGPELTAVLGVTPWVVDRDMTPAERFERLERFVATMSELAIPNPYGVFEWVDAERRWRQMGRDAGWSIESSLVAMNG